MVVRPPPEAEQHYLELRDTPLTPAMQKCYIRTATSWEAVLRTLKLGATGAIILALGGCIATNLERYNRIDITARTIAIPPDSSPLIAGLRGALQADGWTLANPTGPAGSVPPRYWLDIRLIRVDPETCYPSGDPVVKFDLVLYDNRTSDAALTFRGRDCSRDAVATFMNATRRYVKRPRHNLDDENS